MRKARIARIFLVLMFLGGIGYAALVVPTEIQQPGTQPDDISNLQ